MKRDNSHFRRGSGVYKCSLCGIKTRETGEGESGCEMCVDCFNICGEDNGYNDSGSRPNEREAARLDEILANIASKGGDVERVEGFCSYAFPAPVVEAPAPDDDADRDERNAAEPMGVPAGPGKSPPASKMLFRSIPLNMSDAVCAGIMSTALEGGIGYWCCAGEIVYSEGADWNYVSFNAYDADDPDGDDNSAWENGAEVNYETIRDGVARILGGSVKIRSDLFAQVVSVLGGGDGMDVDAEGADCIVQAGLLGDIVFG